jgi:hypothetical protein
MLKLKKSYKIRGTANERSIDVEAYAPTLYFFKNSSSEPI